MAGLFSGLVGGNWSDDPRRNAQGQMGALLGASALLDTHGKTGGQLLSQALQGFVQGSQGERGMQLKERDVESDIAYKRALMQGQQADWTMAVGKMAQDVYKSDMSNWMQANAASIRTTGQRLDPSTRPTPDAAMQKTMALFGQQGAPGGATPPAGQMGAGGLLGQPPASAPQPPPQTPPTAPGNLLAQAAAPQMAPPGAQVTPVAPQGNLLQAGLGAPPLGTHQGPVTAPQQLTPPGGGGMTGPGDLQNLQVGANHPLAERIRRTSMLLDDGQATKEDLEFMKTFMPKMAEGLIFNEQTGGVERAPNYAQAAAGLANYAAEQEAMRNAALSPYTSVTAANQAYGEKLGARTAEVQTARGLNQAQTADNLTPGWDPKTGRPTTTTIGNQRAAIQGGAVFSGPSAQESANLALRQKKQEGSLSGFFKRREEVALQAKGARETQETMTNLRRLGANTGTFTETGGKIVAGIKALGFPLSAEDEKFAFNTESFGKVIGRKAFQESLLVRGVQTEMDAQRINKFLPSLDATKETNQFTMDLLTAAAIKQQALDLAYTEAEASDDGRSIAQLEADAIKSVADIDIWSLEPMKKWDRRFKELESRGRR